MWMIVVVFLAVVPTGNFLVDARGLQGTYSTQAACQTILKTEQARLDAILKAKPAPPDLKIVLDCYPTTAEFRFGDPEAQVGKPPIPQGRQRIS